MLHGNVMVDDLWLISQDGVVIAEEQMCLQRFVSCEAVSGGEDPPHFQLSHHNDNTHLELVIRPSQSGRAWSCDIVTNEHRLYRYRKLS